MSSFEVLVTAPSYCSKEVRVSVLWQVPSLGSLQAFWRCVLCIRLHKEGLERRVLVKLVILLVRV